MAWNRILVGVVASLVVAGCGSHATPTRPPHAVTKPTGPPVRAHGLLLVQLGRGPHSSEGDVYLVDAAGGQPRLLVSAVDVGEEPRWSPDGRRVLVSVMRHGEDDLRSYPVAGGSPTEVSHLRGFEYQGQWSPDGTRVAFLLQRRGSDSDLYVAPAGGGHAHLLVRNADSLAWSPDGRLLAFAPGLESKLGAGLWAVPPSGGPPRSLGGTGGDHIMWGPGHRLAYGVGTISFSSEYLLTPAGEIDVGAVGAAQFLADGTLAFGADRRIGFLRPDGTRRTAPLPDRETSLAWSRDGRYLAFASAWTGRFYVARGDGSGWRGLDSLTDVSSIAWQPRP